MNNTTLLMNESGTLGRCSKETCTSGLMGWRRWCMDYDFRMNWSFDRIQNEWCSGVCRDVILRLFCQGLELTRKGQGLALNSLRAPSAVRNLIDHPCKDPDTENFHLTKRFFSSLQLAVHIRTLKVAVDCHWKVSSAHTCTPWTRKWSYPSSSND